MNNRFQRGKAGGISPFFAFQDIITSAMAVIITIVMLLALNMGDPRQVAEGDQDSAKLSQQLENLLRDLADENAKFRAMQDAAASATLGPAVLKAEIEAMRGELAMVEATTRKGEQGMANGQHNEGAKIVRSELAKQEAVTAAASRQLADREKDAVRSLAEMKAADESLRQKEAQLLAEQARRNELWLLPERSKTNKEPVVAVVSGDAVVMQRFDHPEKTEVRGRGLPSKFEDALKAYSKLDQYIVFYFKPSGVENFQALTDAAKSAGFEIGYDAVGEEMAINLSAPR